MSNVSLNAPGLLRAAARLVERALLDLDTTSAPCPHCETMLFRDRADGRLYEQLANTPTRLRTAAEKLDGHLARQSSPGFADAMRMFQEEGS